MDSAPGPSPVHCPTTKAIPLAAGWRIVHSSMLLAFDHVSFRYGRKTPVFNDFSLRIDEQATVLLGPNGAGKSTLMAIAASHLPPSSGSVTFNGGTAKGRHLATYRESVAWIPQQITPMPGLTVREQVAYAGWLKGMPKDSAWKASEDALRRVDLTRLAERKSHQVSGGQLRRMGIAGALTHRSELILMDEPTAGLDPTQRLVFRELVDDLAGSVQVIVSTHQTEDLADLYTHVVVLAHGKICFQGSPADFHALAPNATHGREQAEAAYVMLVGREI
ncbi:ATP-binding cassette domain-containing protein [Streptomyces sp. 3211]|uniref:ATP-binding cassette domain-containing protein n=1 Tax=Streptomyces sp. 3211 TaxID=1964449 RepID=UPI00180D129E|nr:ATP-binding cassette domain-containing protein [Streptomyces sp. 3211]